MYPTDGLLADATKQPANHPACQLQARQPEAAKCLSAPPWRIVPHVNCRRRIRLLPGPEPRRFKPELGPGLTIYAQASCTNNSEVTIWFRAVGADHDLWDLQPLNRSSLHISDSHWLSRRSSVMRARAARLARRYWNCDNEAS